MDIDAVADQTFAKLEESGLGTVVAVWRDGEVSVHRQLGFRRRALPDGSFEEPLTTFVRFTDLFSRWAIAERLKEVLAERPAKR